LAVRNDDATNGLFVLPQELVRQIRAAAGPRAREAAPDSRARGGDS
jgi:hypothetical protein